MVNPPNISDIPCAPNTINDLVYTSDVVDKGYV